MGAEKKYGAGENCTVWASVCLVGGPWLVWWWWARSMLSGSSLHQKFAQAALCWRIRARPGWAYFLFHWGRSIATLELYDLQMCSRCNVESEQTTCFAEVSVYKDSRVGRGRSYKTDQNMLQRIKGSKQSHRSLTLNLIAGKDTIACNIASQPYKCWRLCSCLTRDPCKEIEHRGWYGQPRKIFEKSVFSSASLRLARFPEVLSIASDFTELLSVLRMKRHHKQLQANQTK